MARQHVTVSTHTPWGKANSKVSYGRGVTFYSTPGHGGFKVSAKLNETMHPALRLDDGWYEEDCDWARVALAFPDRFTADEGRSALDSFINYNPDGAAVFLGREIKIEESSVLRERAFRVEHQNDWVAIAAYGDWHDAVPAGFVGIHTTRGGQRGVYGQPAPAEAGFLVPKDEYEQRNQFGFVVDPAKHTAWDEHAKIQKAANQ